jgi:hypothetical protein
MSWYRFFCDALITLKTKLAYCCSKKYMSLLLIMYASYVVVVGGVVVVVVALGMLVAQS